MRFITLTSADTNDFGAVCCVNPNLIQAIIKCGGTTRLIMVDRLTISVKESIEAVEKACIEVTKA